MKPGVALFQEHDLLKMDREEIRQVRGAQIAMAFYNPLKKNLCLNVYSRIHCIVLTHSVNALIVKRYTGKDHTMNESES